MASTARRRNLGRISEIAQVAVRHGFGYFFETHRLTDLLPGRPKLSAAAASPSERGRHLREMLDELGPTFVKFGQLLSTRPDVVPPDIVVELQKLQDDVRPVPYEDVERVIREDLELSVEQLFTDFDPTPIAAASIGQVHRATLPNGRRVAVKVQRPNAPRQIEADLALLYQAARLIRERVRALEFIDPRQLVDEFARSIRQELDYRLEARNAEAFHHQFSGHPHVQIPRVYWSYTRTRVLTLELIEGIQLADLPLDAWEMEERRRLAYLMAETWMTMIFRHGFFHGDPHPSNILVLPDGRIGLVDFGLAGSLTDEDMSRLTRLFVDAATENVEALPRRLAELGVRYDKEREGELRSAIEELYYRYYGSSLSDIDPIEVIREGLDLIYSLKLRLPSRFVTLDKTIATLGAVGVELYPAFNVFEVAKPYARGLLAERFSPRRMSLRAQHEVRELAGIARELPYQARDVLEQTRQGRLELQVRNPGLDDLAYHIDHAVNRLAVALIVLGGLVGSSIVGVLAKTGPHVLGLHVLSFVGFTLSGAFALWLIWGIARSGRL
jgi:ubiquinone biosynthesis protein